MVRHHSELRKYQWKGIHFGLRNPFCALFLDMGLGKTAIVLSIIAYLLKIKKLKKPILIVAPIRVVETVWRQEAAAWSHTKHIRFSMIRGNVKQRLEALHAKAHVYLINPESLVWLLTLFQHKHALENWPFGGLIVDESSKFKAPGSKRFKKLRHVIWLFDQLRIILSGTPVPNSLLDLWAQMFIVDQGERLGDTVGGYKARYFMPEIPPEIPLEFLDPRDPNVQRIRYVPRPGTPEYINEMIGDVTLRMEAADWLDMPPTVYNRIDITLDHEVQAMYDKFEDEMFLEFDDGVDVDAVHAGALRMKCHQFANGALYYEEDKGLPTARMRWREIHRHKLDALEELTDGTGDNIMICYQFKHDLERLNKMFPDAPVIGRRTARMGRSTLKITDIVEQWNERRFKHLLIHPKSGGHGLNMQFGGRTIAFFSLTDSYEDYDQVINRIGGARAQGVVTVHNLVVKNTADEAIIGNIADKATGQNNFLRRLKEYRHARLQSR